MSGIAGKLFQERSKKNISEDLKKCQWPLLDQMMAAKRLGYIDLSLAHRFLHNGSPENAPAASLICHLSMAARKGHVCVIIQEDSIIPSPEEIWVSEEPGQSHVPPSAFKDLKQLILQASQKIRSDLICDANHTADHFQTPIIKHNHSFYLQRYWYLESLFLSEIKQKFTGKCPTISIDPAVVENKLEQLKTDGKLLKEQAEAILKASQSLLTLITGGPGTGKTYTAGLLLKIIWEAIGKNQKMDFTIALAAPTGKAAANLEESIRRTLDEFPEIKAQTLHQLLGIKKNGYGQDISSLKADLVLIDESSMIDIKLMGQLFSALKPGSRLIMLGDKNQLASIEAGSLFADLVRSEIASVVELKTCMRSELKSIIDFADQIKAGNVEEALKNLEKNIEGISWTKFDDELNTKEQQKRLLYHSLHQILNCNKLPEDPLNLLMQFNRFRILTPLRKGPFGADALNGMIFQAISNKMEKNGIFIAPIMLMQTDYRLGLFNGETGLIVREKDQEFAFFPSREPEQKWRQIPSLLLPRWEYAYCLSIHKSQGSEFDHVILLLPDGTETFGRKALYTGITRAKKRLEIWCHPKVLSQMITLVGTRQSGIIERLRISH